MKISMENYNKIQKKADVTTKEQKVLGFFYDCSDITEWKKDDNFSACQESVENMSQYIKLNIARSGYIAIVTAISQIPFAWIDRFSGKARRVYGIFMYGMIPCE